MQGSVSNKFLDLLWFFDGKLSSGLRHRATTLSCRALDDPNAGTNVGSPGAGVRTHSPSTSILIVRRKVLGSVSLLSYSVHTFQTRLTQSFPSNSSPQSLRFCIGFLMILNPAVRSGQPVDSVQCWLKHINSSVSHVFISDL